ncbi:methanogenesis marker protein Mmp4/MtxX [Methanomethylophilus alvi]|uniref:methanogenesis marker protein Mmp4/MtxX n=1 Tax=Methanomethylophilus alvi TaxID=1291540 RepID=UPI00033DCA96|nr:phosphotransacetylase-like protein [Methanoculleus sp. CAG:1088]
MVTSDEFLGGRLPDVKVGIGCAPESKFVETSVRVMDNPNVVIYSDPQKLADDLSNGVIDAAVRGDMSSSKLLPLIKNALGVDDLQRAVLMDYRGRVFLMAPVGIDEGWTVEDKVQMAEKGAALMKDMGLPSQRIAVMSGGRSDDIGRNDIVDKTITDALEVVRQLNRKGYDAYHAQILIEDVVEDADIVIAPDGIAGNLIFRVMHFIGNVTALGAPVLNGDKVFVDTSRVKTDFTDSIILAMKLAGMRH